MSLLNKVIKVTYKITYFGALSIIFKDYLCEPAVCCGDSMLPTLNSKGDVVIVEKLSPRLRSLRRGDVVVSTSPEDPEKLICKRIIGLVEIFFSNLV